MKFVLHLDNHKLHKPATDFWCSTHLSTQFPYKTEHLRKKHAKVFKEGVGQLEGEHHIQLDSRVDPVQHTPRRVPVSLRGCLKEILDGMVQQGMKNPPPESAPWSWFLRRVACCASALTPRFLTMPYNLGTTHYQSLRILHHDCTV